MFFPDANDAISNVPAGFDTGFVLRFVVSGSIMPTTVLVRRQPAGDAFSGGGARRYASRRRIGGSAKSIGVEAPTNPTALDDTTLGSADPVGSSVAEPAILAVLGAGLGLAAVMLGRLVGPDTHRRVDGSPGACDKVRPRSIKSQKKKPAPPK